VSYETKAGVAVSCSFLCLVGVVLSSKLWEGQAANAGTAPAEAGPGAGAAPPKTNLAELFKDEEDPFQIAPYQSATNPGAPALATIPSPGVNQSGGTTPPSNPVVTPPAPTIPVVANPSPPIDLRQLDGNSSPVKPLDTPVKTAVPAAAGAGAVATNQTKPADKSLEEILKGMQGGAAAPPPELKKVGQDAGNAVTAGANPAATPEKTALEKMVEADDKQKADAAALAATAAQQKPTIPSDDDLKKMLTKQSELAQNAAGDQINKQIGGLSDQGLSNTQAPNRPGPIMPSMGNEMGNPVKPPMNSSNLAGSAAPSPNMNAGLGQMPPRIPTGGTDGYPGQADATAINAGSRVIQPVSLGSPSATPPNNQFAQAGNGGAAPDNPESAFVSRPEARVQPMAAPAPSTPAPAQKDHWDDDMYVGQAGDTFKRIASDKYGSDRYAQALEYYNRDHVLATDATRRDPATIMSNQRIYIPPARILQREYESVIPSESEAAAGRTGPAATRPAAPGASPAAGLPEKSYRVRGGGEMFLTIARNTLGNDLRWPEIYNLNQRFAPEVEVPGGTILRMPGDAKIDPADVASK
jgi:hypothetical protein